jgi:aspartyl-tRNA(Asn)/glutamyl-tRNA(Gln) amidotransferase subunit B
MQEGSLRVDANINLHVDTPQGRVATPIVEVKNVNSFRAVERAMEYEARRQYEEWLDTRISLAAPGGQKTTRGWDDQAEVTKPQRQKEESSDYRYFPDPDLVPVTVTESEIEAVHDRLGELPAALRDRLQTDFGLDAYDADVLVNQGRELVDYFLELAKQTGDAKRSSNWVQQHVLRTLNEHGLGIGEFPVSVETLADLLKGVASGVLDSTRAKDVFQELAASGGSVEQAMKKLGIEQVDQSEVVDLCRSLLDEHPHVVADVKNGKQKAVGALIGKAKQRNPNVNPNDIRQICLDLIAKM